MIKLNGNKYSLVKFNRAEIKLNLRMELHRCGIDITNVMVKAIILIKVNEIMKMDLILREKFNII